jgi:phage terminase large subunit-like protein
MSGIYIPPPQQPILEGVGEVVARFAEEWIVQTKGRWAGKPLSLQPWQKSLFNELFLVYEDGSRVYREALLGISRKNGKSTISAVLALYMLLASGEEGPEVYAAAASKDQARIVFNQACEMVEASPRLRDWLTPQRNAIICKANNGVFRVLASDAPNQYGLNPSGVVIDELWAHKNDELYYALTTGQLARESPLVVSISTAGFDRNTICHELYTRGRRLEAEGGLDELRKQGFFFRWFEAKPGATVQDPDAWRAANPSEWITAHDLQRESERLPDSVFRRLHLNQWTESEDAWIKPHEWDMCAGKPEFDPTQPSWMALDVGVKRDSAGLVWGQWHGDDLHIGQRILDPAEEAEGFGVADVRARVAEEAGRQQALKEVNYDPWSFRESAEILLERGLPMLEFPQNSSRMSPASEQLYELVKEGRVVHDGSARMRAHVLAAVIAPTDRGGWRISKRKSLEAIDGAVALAMMADRAITMRNAKPPSRAVYFT